MMSYFGTDQSQVQRYITGSSIRESRLGLLFNAVCKIPMQFGILLLGVMMFVFYQFQQPPMFFDTASNKFLQENKLKQTDHKLLAYEKDFNSAHDRVRENLNGWVTAKRSGDESIASTAFNAAAQAQLEGEKLRLAATEELEIKNPGKKANNADYVFITFILQELPHGVIGLLVAAFFTAALSSKAAELNALGTSSTIDFYRLLSRGDVTDSDCVRVTKLFTAFWGVIAILIALFAHLSENLIQAVNILGSIFYGVLLALFVVAFFVRSVGGTALFWSALLTQALIFVLYCTLTISYLWYPLIGCAVCVLVSLIFQAVLPKNQSPNNQSPKNQSIIENFGS